ncbi:hypothetical protein ACFSBI_01355, partial [Amnibacterium endophyticum]
MIAALGALGGAGVLLILAPRLWPGSARRPRERRRAGAAIEERLAGAGVGGLAPAGFVLASA